MNKIKSKRLEKDWTQKTLATEAGLSINSIVAYERGTKSPTIRALEKIANALGCSVKDLVSDD